MYFVNINLIFLFRILLQIYYQKTSYEREREIFEHDASRIFLNLNCRSRAAFTCRPHLGKIKVWKCERLFQLVSHREGGFLPRGFVSFVRVHDIDNDLRPTQYFTRIYFTYLAGLK